MINPLWLGVQNIDFLAMVDSVQTIIESPTEYKNFMKVPYANPLILFAFLPFVGAVLGCLLCIFVCSGACCCSAASRYRKRNKKLQKESHKILIKYGIDAKGALPSSIVADSTQISPEERTQIVQEMELQKPRLEKVMKKAKCAKWCWWAWLLSAILYILSIIFVISGISFFGGMPKSFTGVANKQVKVVTDLLESMATVGDDALKALYGTNEKVFTELIKKESTFNATLASFRTNAKIMHSLDDLKGNMTLLDKKLTEWIGSILFYPTVDPSNYSYAVAGQAAVYRLLDGFSDMKTLMDQLKTTVTTIKNLKTNVPTSIQTKFDSIPPIPDMNFASTDTKAIVDNLMTGRALTKWQFMDTISSKFLVTQLPASMQDFINLLIPRNALGVLKGSQTLFSVAGTSPDSLFDMVKNPITGFVDQIADLLQKVYDSEYLETMLVLKTISFTELSTQLGTPKSAACPYIWCGKINVTSLTDNFGTIPVLKSFKTDSLETLLKKPIPIVYSICLVIPFLILIITALCMGCKKTCCSTCSICCCPFCNCAITILGILLMMLSLVTSGILTPITNSLRSDATNLFDTGMKIGQNQSFINPTVNFNVPSISMLSMTPSTLNIDLSSMQALLASVNINITVGQIIPPLAQTPATGVMASMLSLLDVTSTGQLLNKAITYIQTSINAINLNISLAGSDLSKMFSKEQLGILNMLKIGSNTLQQFLRSTIDSALNVFLDDNFNIIQTILNATAIGNKINGYLDSDLITKIKDMSGFDITTISGISASSGLSDKLQEAYCRASVIPEGKRSDITTVSGLFKQMSDAYSSAVTSAATGTAITAPTYTPPQQPADNVAVELFEAIFANLWVEFLADQGQLLSTLGTSPVDANAVSADVTSYIQNALFSSGDTPNSSINSLLNTIATASFSGKTLDDFAARYSSCPSTNDVDNSNAVTTAGPFTNLINVPTEFIANLVQRKVITHQVTRPTVSPSDAASTADFYLYRGMGVMFQVHCQYISQLVVAANKLETTPPALTVTTAHASGLADAINQIRVLKTNLVTLNAQIGTMQLDVTSSPTFSTTCSGSYAAKGPAINTFLSGFATDIIAVVRSIFLNVVETLKVTSSYGLFFKSFTEVGMLSKIKSFALNIIDQFLNLLCGSASPLNSSILGMAPQIMSDSVGAAFGWFDAFSFACYLSFLFMFFGPMCMAFGYNYNRYYNYEKKMSKKYKYKFVFGKEPAHKKRGKKSKQTEIVVANNDSLFEQAQQQQLAPPPEFNSQFI
ncbi:Conserved_hypothetical protein [Hexamita inflata]|uniref:Uncharacterized protein n=1 Tax=Hexamita inflata TaxID=28002 RepID=A0AA86V9F8_9EUKA|nr:Conserved hypothetical protein [Hexamita inflata]